MKLVIATPLYPPEIGGPATYAKALNEGLPKKGVEIEMVKFSDVRRWPKFISHYVYYRRVMVAARKADLVLALDPVSTGLPAMLAAQSAEKPFVVKIVGDYAWEQGRQRFGVVQNLDDFVQTPQRNFFVRKLQKVQTRVAAAATRVIVPSEYLKKIVMQWGIPAEKIEVIYNGIALPQEIPTPVRPSGFEIVSAGRRVPWKGFEAIERIVAQEPGWHFRVVHGVGRAETLGHIRGADAFVLNSSYEGLSHVLIEAMMLQTPIIATAAGGNPELIEDGKTGLLVPVGDDAALHAALRNIADNPVRAHERAAAALVRARTLFSEDAMLLRTLQLITSLV